MKNFANMKKESLVSSQSNVRLDLGKSKVCWKQNDSDQSIVRKMQSICSITKDTTVDEAINKIKANCKAITEMAVIKDTFEYQYEDLCQRAIMSIIAFDTMDSTNKGNFLKPFIESFLYCMRQIWETMSHLRFNHDEEPEHIDSPNNSTLGVLKQVQNSIIKIELRLEALENRGDSGYQQVSMKEKFIRKRNMITLKLRASELPKEMQQKSRLMGEDMISLLGKYTESAPLVAQVWKRGYFFFAKYFFKNDNEGETAAKDIWQKGHETETDLQKIIVWNNTPTFRKQNYSFPKRNFRQFA